MSHVRTVLGDVDDHDLGRLDYHEHLFQVSPLLPGDDLDNEAASTAEAGMLRAAGISAMVDATPIGLGRDPAALARISAATGLQIVATTGAHRDGHYGTGHWITELTVDELAQRFLSEVEQGQPIVDTPERTATALTPSGQSVRAGVLKGGAEYWSISAFQRRVFEAIGRTHQSTGIPVMVHLEHGSAAFEVLELLDAFGVPAQAVALAHIDRNPDPGLHAELAATGAYLGYDGMGRAKDWPDSVVLDCLIRTAQRGGSERILLGGDVARRSRYLAYGGMPGLTYLPTRFLPRLAAAGSAELVEQVLVDNPHRWLSLR